MNQQFKDVQTSVVGSVCWNNIDIAFTSIQALKPYQGDYMARRTASSADNFLQNYRQFNIEYHLNYLLNSLNGLQTDCNILTLLK